MAKSVEEVIAKWDNEPKEAARKLIEDYGQPDECTPSMLIWHNTTDGWKRFELTNKPTPHRFPVPHNDYLSQVIDYKVPIGMFSTLAAFDGSIVADRTRGEMSAHGCDTAMNFIAINLAHDIITGRRTVDLARAEYALLYEAVRDGEKPTYATGFQFEAPFGDTRDPDTEAMTPQIRDSPYIRFRESRTPA